MTSKGAIQKVVLVGGSGNVGSLLIAPLAAAFDLTLLSRSASTAKFPDDARVVRAEYTLEGLTEAFTGQDAVVSAVGAAGLGDQKLLVDAAIKAGVQRFLPSEFSMNSLPSAARELFPPFEAKFETIQYLRAKESQGLSWTGIGTGPLVDWVSRHISFAQVETHKLVKGLKAGFLDFDLQNKRAKIWDVGSTTYSAVTVADLGKAVVNTLRKPGQTANKYIFVNSVTTSQAGILNAFKKSTGDCWTVEQVNTIEEVAAAKKALVAGDFAGALKLVQAMAWSNLPGMHQDFERDEEESLANDVLEIRGQSIESIVDGVLASQA